MSKLLWSVGVLVAVLIGAGGAWWFFRPPAVGADPAQVSLASESSPQITSGALNTDRLSGGVKVQAKGEADASLPNAREAAIEQALRKAVETGAGVELAGLSETRDYMLVRDAMFVKTAGYVRSYDVLQENPNENGVYTVRVQALIGQGHIDADIEAIKALIKRKGRPRVLVLVAKETAPINASQMESFVDQVGASLKNRGLHVLDGGTLAETIRTRAERAARGDSDAKEAALISHAIRADVYCYLRLVGGHVPETHYGAKVFPVRATVKLVRADTAQILGSQEVEQRLAADSEQIAWQQGLPRLWEAALNGCVAQIAKHWLEDVDARGGGEITVIMRKFRFERVTALVVNLRKVKGVKDVIIGPTDTEAEGQIRVVCNASAADLIAVLKRLDASLNVVSSTHNTVTVK